MPSVWKISCPFWELQYVGAKQIPLCTEHRTICRTVLRTMAEFPDGYFYIQSKKSGNVLDGKLCFRRFSAVHSVIHNTHQNSAFEVDGASTKVS